MLAPADSAFSQLPKEQIEELMSDPDALQEVLTYHVIPGKLSAADLLVAGEAEQIDHRRRRNELGISVPVWESPLTPT